MRRWLRRSRRIALGMLATLLPFGCAYVLLAGPPWNPVCTSEARMRILGLSGYDFEVSELDCDTLAKDSSINVFISRPGHSRKTLVFKYDPGGNPDNLPTIKRSGEGTFEITVEKVSSIFCIRKNWDKLSFGYNIRVIYHPDPVTEVCS